MTTPETPRATTQRPRVIINGAAAHPERDAGAARKEKRQAAFASQMGLSKEQMKIVVEAHALPYMAREARQKELAASLSLSPAKFEKMLDRYSRAINSGDRPPPYCVSNGALTYMHQVKASVVPVKLANFAARIEEDMKIDDGAEVARHFRFSATLENGDPLRAVCVI
jgi:hypothetical protein